MQLVLNALALFAIGMVIGVGIFLVMPGRDWRGLGLFAAGCSLWAFGMAFLLG